MSSMNDVHELRRHFDEYVRMRMDDWRVLHDLYLREEDEDNAKRRKECTNQRPFHARLQEEVVEMRIFE